MSDVYKNFSVNLSSTAQTTVYEVPTASVSTTPPQRPVQAIIKSIRVCNVVSSATTISIVNVDKSLGPAEINITKLLSVDGNTAVEVLQAPYVLEDGDIIKATATVADRFHITVSVLEIS